MNNRDWTVLFIGGASGTGKSSLAYEIARLHGVNVLEVDDVIQSLEAMTTIESLPAIHYWSTGIKWMDVGVAANVDWLISVSKEIAPALKAIADRHIEDKLPIIIEGDFIHPELIASFENPGIKGIFVREPDKEQIVQNYLARESGEPQEYRAEISIEYGKWQAKLCEKLGIHMIDSRPWETLAVRMQRWR